MAHTLTTENDTRGRPGWALKDPLLTAYYDTEWGLPVTDEAGVFERLSLEAFQAGMSWLVVLRKRARFREVFCGFAPERVAGFDQSDVSRLLEDAGIIRNRAKIEATVSNARAALALREAKRPLHELVWSFAPERSPAPARDADIPRTSPESTALAAELRGNGFRFVGPTSCFALMATIGVVDAHLTTSFRRGTSGLWHPDGSRRTVLPLQAPAEARG